MPLPVEQNIEPQDIALKIVYEDRDLLVNKLGNGCPSCCRKPRRNPCQRSSGSLWCPSCWGTGEGQALFTVWTRILPACWLLLKMKCLFASFSPAKGKENKRGIPWNSLWFSPAEKGTIDLPLGRMSVIIKFAVKKDGGGRQAITHYKAKKVDPYALLLLRLETGRTPDQGASFLPWMSPRWGSLYGTRRASSGKGQLLHARTLGFVHPAVRNIRIYSGTGRRFLPNIKPGGKRWVF